MPAALNPAPSIPQLSALLTSLPGDFTTGVHRLAALGFRYVDVVALVERPVEHSEALAALHDLARLPNREIALATAEVVQRCVGIDMGLALGEPSPPLHSRQAAEVTRRVMSWAFGQDGSADATPHPLLSRRLQEG